MNYKIYALVSYLVLKTAFSVYGGYVEVSPCRVAIYDTMASVNQPTTATSIDGSASICVDELSNELRTPNFLKHLARNLLLGAISNKDFFSFFSKHTYATLPDIKQTLIDYTVTDILEVLDSLSRPVLIDIQNKMQIQSTTPFENIGGF
jgi:hypothetical protein